ncbi:MAG: CbtB-domain containing protein [Deltaproteobacteria bacterium]|nr:CbtB-domain containing protein [Deltaproteobacteria bacterium]
MSEASSFYLKSAVFMAVVGVLLYVSLAAAYPPVHDALHDLRHGLAIVPCH